jgi:NAD(P)-dependent dehydrogenase (short-subunit alcohol dehydrogenase family)
VALVTGANRGFGRQLTAQLVARGAAKVYAAARKPETITTAGVVPIRMTSLTRRR